jgi:hypothetical protein
MRKETLHLVKNVLRHNLNILHIDERLVFSNYDYSNIEKQNAESAYNKEYENLKLLQAEIFTFSSGIQERN